MTRLTLSALLLAAWILNLPACWAGDEKSKDTKAKLGLDDIIRGLEKSEKAWGSLKSWMLRYEHAREAINFSLPIVYHPHEVMNARKGGWLYASWTPVTPDKDSSQVWVLWRDEKYTQRFGDGVSTNGKEEVVKAPDRAGMLYSIWWYPNSLGIDLVSDAYPVRREDKEGPPAYLLARYLKANKDKFRVRKELELVDKIPCHVLEWEGRDVIWVDPEAGFGVRRRTAFQHVGANLAHEYKALRFQQRSPGVWLPDRQVAVTFTGGVGEKASRVEKVITSTLKEARFNDLPDDFFTVPLPKGVNAKDKDKKPAPARDAADLAPPVAVTVGGILIDRAADAVGYVRGDNSFPWVGDFDGDGKFDLLVGQHAREKSGEGHLRIYRNLGGKMGPRFAEPIWFDDQVPTGRIPHG